MTVYKITCPVCSNEGVEEKLNPVFHDTHNNGYILVMGIPNFHCEECNSTIYRKSFDMGTILNGAIKTNNNVILFDEDDWIDLIS